jgi:hypothetical protein
VASWGGTLDFVYLPDAARFLPQYAFDRRLAERHHEKVLRVAADLGIPIIDVLPAFEAQPDPISLFPFRGPGHYAEGGHRLVAEKVLKTITRSGILRNRGVIADAGDTRWARPRGRRWPRRSPRRSRSIDGSVQYAAEPARSGTVRPEETAGRPKTSAGRARRMRLDCPETPRFGRFRVGSRHARSRHPDRGATGPIEPLNDESRNTFE